MCGAGVPNAGGDRPRPYEGRVHPVGATLVVARLGAMCGVGVPNAGGDKPRPLRGPGYIP